MIAPSRASLWLSRLLPILVVLVAIVVAAWPKAALACGLTDMDCQGDAITYNLWSGVAKLLWFFNRLLLLGAYLLDIIRREILNAMDAPFTAISSFADSLIISIATLALMLAMILILIMPMTGAASPFNVRQILVLTMLAPVVFASLGSWLVDLDTFRSDLSQYIYSVSANSNVGGPVISSMEMSGAMGATTDGEGFLYPATGQCGQMLLPRYSGGLEEDRVLRPDEAAAAFLFANAIDIHCPELGNGPEKDLPQGFYNQPSPGYAYAGGVRDLSENDRAIALAGVQAGAIRLFSGIFITVLVLLFYIAQLVFTLAVIALFVGLVFGFLFGFFKKDFGWLGEFFSRTGSILQASWISSFLLGLLFAALVATAQTGNAGVFAGLALGQLVFALHLMLNAFGTLKSALEALATLAGGLMGGANVMGQTVGMAGKLAGGVPGMVLGGAMGAAGAGASAARGAGTALMTGAVAGAQTGSGRYAVGAMAGRIAPIAKLGEVAAGLGVLPDEVRDGLRAGQAATGSNGFRALNQKARSDAKTHSPQVRVRREQQVEQKAHNTIGLARAGSINVQDKEAVRKHMAGQPHRRLTTPTEQNYPSMSADPADPNKITFAPRQRRADLPDSAVTEQLDNQAVHQRLKDGAHAQFNPDGTVTHWKPAQAASTAGSPSDTGTRTGDTSPRVTRPRPAARRVAQPAAQPAAVPSSQAEPAGDEPQATPRSHGRVTSHGRVRRASLRQGGEQARRLAPPPAAVPSSQAEPAGDEPQATPRPHGRVWRASPQQGGEQARMPAPPPAAPAPATAGADTSAPAPKRAEKPTRSATYRSRRPEPATPTIGGPDRPQTRRKGAQHTPDEDSWLDS